MLTDEMDVSEKNKIFWNELCGTQLAQSLGIKEHNYESLKKFDDFYFDYYPYLKSYFKKEYLENKKVLEIGLGYGSLARYFMQNHCHYYGLDIAENPVKLAQYSANHLGVSADVRQGSILSSPFPSHYFDTIVSIGCLHHTGNFTACMDEIYRMLKPNGIAVIMVYNKYSLRQWCQWPMLTIKSFINEMIKKEKSIGHIKQNYAYDKNSKDEAAPFTEFFSKKDTGIYFKKFSNLNIYRDNFDDQFKLSIGKIPIFRFSDRKKYLNSIMSKLFGLDLYIIAKNNKQKNG